MKTIQNKETSIKSGDVLIKYSNLINTCINNIDPQKGATASDMRSAIRVMDAVEKEVIELEDADFAFLKQKVNEMKWAIIHKDVLAFIDYINEL